MADAGAGRHYAEIVERGRAPAQEGVTLAVSLIFLVDIDLEGAVRPEGIHHHRMIDDEIDRRLRIDRPRIAAERSHGVAHGGEIDHGGDTGEVMHQDARRPKRDLAIASLLLEPKRSGANVGGGGGTPGGIAQRIDKGQLEREGRTPDTRTDV